MKSDHLTIFCLLFLINSCNGINKEANQYNEISDSTFTSKSYERIENVESNNLDSVKLIILEENKNSKDTLKYYFSIEDVGTEGNDGTAYYLNNALKKVKFDIYTSMWKINLLYLFNNNDILVTEKTFNTFENAKQIKKISYLMNIEGVTLGKVDSSRVDVFQEIKNVVPFTLK